MNKIVKSLVAGAAILGTVFVNGSNASEQEERTQHLSGHANAGDSNTSSDLENRSNDVTDMDAMFASSSDPR